MAKKRASVSAHAAVSVADTSPVRIAVLAYDGCLGLQVFGLVDVLRIGTDVQRSLGKPSRPLAVEICSVSGGAVVLAGGTTVETRRLRGRPELLVVPGFDPRGGEDLAQGLTRRSGEARAVRRVFARGSAVASICTGAFLLGSAGLLDGRTVTTSWMFGTQLARAFPAAVVRTDALLLEDGGVTTTGAVSAAFDLALHLVKQHLGAATASATANVSLLPNMRSDQRPFVDARLLEASTGAFAARVRDWFASRLKEPYELARVAAAFKVSPRTLMRRVKAESGQSPLALLQQLRVEEAKRLLARPGASIERVTEAVGYVDAVTFARLFTRLVGESPARYRRRTLQ